MSVGWYITTICLCQMMSEWRLSVTMSFVCLCVMAACLCCNTISLSPLCCNFVCLLYQVGREGAVHDAAFLWQPRSLHRCSEDWRPVYTRPVSVLYSSHWHMMPCKCLFPFSLSLSSATTPTQWGPVSSLHMPCKCFTAFPTGIMGLSE